MARYTCVIVFVNQRVAKFLLIKIEWSRRILRYTKKPTKCNQACLEMVFDRLNTKAMRIGCIAFDSISGKSPRACMHYKSTNLEHALLALLLFSLFLRTL